MASEYTYCEGLGCELRDTCRRYRDLQIQEDENPMLITACPEDRPYYDQIEFYGC